MAEECSSCRGRGKILKVIDCCERGCGDCSQTRVKVNGRWREIRLKGENNDEVFPCRICSQQVGLTERILKLNCGHAFHRICILEWLVENGQKCYLCKQRDPFLDG